MSIAHGYIFFGYEIFIEQAFYTTSQYMYLFAYILTMLNIY